MKNKAVMESIFSITLFTTYSLQRQNASVLARQLNVNVLHHKIMWNWIVGVLLLSAATHFIKSIRAYFTSVAKLKRLNNQVSEINKRRKGTLQWLKSNIKVSVKM